jgi:hypothetical protein
MSAWYHGNPFYERARRGQAIAGAFLTFGFFAIEWLRQSKGDEYAQACTAIDKRLCGFGG